MTQSQPSVVVLGAGPAGLGLAWRLARRQFGVTVVERQQAVGGNSGSFELAGLRVDFGSHRLHPACDPEIMADIRRLLGADLLDRPRHGRIRLRGRWLHFPLKPLDLATQLPPSFLLGVMTDALRKLAPSRNGQPTFATQLERGLGRTICRDFYFPYARKIWGLAPEELDVEQARRRVSAGSFLKLARKVASAVPGFKPPGAGRFFYPRKGFGQISDALATACRGSGVDLRLGTTFNRVNFVDGHAANVEVSDGSGTHLLETRLVLSTIPLTRLLGLLAPEPPSEVLSAASALRTRAMILVYLVLQTERFTEYDAHYFPGAEIAITRLSEPKNYGLAELPGRTVLCAELPCATTDDVWKAADAQLGTLVTTALERAGLPVRAPLLQVATRRLADAYPIYTRDFQPHFARLDGYVADLPGLITLGRQGLFVHDNTHHTLAMSYRLAECLDDEGRLDRERWAAARREFEQNVVED